MKITSLVFMVLLAGCSYAQNPALERKEDSMRILLNTVSQDSAQYQMNVQSASFYGFRNIDSAFFYQRLAVDIAEKKKKYLAEAASMSTIMYYYQTHDDLSNAWQSITKGLNIARDPESERTHFILPPDGDFRKQRLEIQAFLEVSLGDLLLYTNNYRESIHQFKTAIEISEGIRDFNFLPQRYLHLSWAYKGMDMPDSSLYYTLLAERTAKEKNLMYNIGFVYNSKAELLLEKGFIKKAVESFHEGLNAAETDRNISMTISACLGLSNCYLLMNEKDSSLYYALKARSHSQSHSGVYENLHKSYLLRNEKDSAFKYMALAKQAKEDYYRNYVKSLSGFQHLFLQDRMKLQEMEKEKILARNKTRTYLLLGGIGLLLLLSVIFYSTMRHKQKANDSITRAYSELKDTQRQLVQREKMASLGELTAGIAHEIQNPLNFVNNFSDVNKELLLELNDEIKKGNYKEVALIAKDVIENEEKINHHGKRADAIVKGMLQHSRASSGQKEQTDINALADEYLRLAYHGLRAKDKAFNATVKTDFDNSVGKLNILPQEIGRVILNLITNAFYAVNEKQKQHPNTRPDDPVGRGYEPTVTVSTVRNNGTVEIKVKDNGNGIPQRIVDKIFQPFFTTKPTGQGTGLGLSLAYDIVKAHGGELKVKTTEGEGSEFIIEIPNTKTAES